MYWTPICGRYFLNSSILEKCGKIWKNGRFSGRLWPDWGNTALAAMAGLGSIGMAMSNVAIKVLSSLMSNLRKIPCHVPYSISYVTKLYVSCPF